MIIALIAISTSAFNTINPYVGIGGYLLTLLLIIKFSKKNEKL